MERLHRPVACDLCGVDDPEPLLCGPDHQLGGQQRFTLVRCRRCGLIYQTPQPNDLGRYYPQTYAPFRNTGRTATGRVSVWLQERDERALRRLVGRAGRVLEVGCAAGDYLLVLRQHGWEVTGVEFSEHAADIARQRGLDVRTGDLLESNLPAETYDLVLLRHVLEHVASPTKTLSEIHRLLAPHGKVLVLVPNYQSLERMLCGRYWHGYDLPRHLYTFTTRTLIAAIERASLRLHSVHHSSVPTSYVWSVRYWAQEHGHTRLAHFFRSDNLVAIGLFVPLGFLGALTHRAGRIQVLATKA